MFENKDEVQITTVETNKEREVNEMNKDINKEFEQCVYLEIKSFVKELENDLISSHLIRTIDSELKALRLIKDKVKKTEMVFLEIAKKEIDIEKKRGVTVNSINKTLKEIFTEIIKNGNAESLKENENQSKEVGICKDCGKSFNDGHIDLGFEGEIDSLGLCSGCEGKNFYVCKGCGDWADSCLMRVENTCENCLIY